MAFMNKPAWGSVNWYQALTDNWNSIQNNLVDKSIVTAKGDLIAATAAAVVARLAAGANGTALVADSTQSTGLNYSSLPTTFQVSSSSVRATTSTSTTSTTLVAMNSMSLSVTTGATDTVLAIFTASIHSNANAALLALLRGSTVLQQVIPGNRTYGPTSGTPGVLMAIDQPGAGTFTYSVQWASSNGGTVLQDLAPFSSNGDRELVVVVLPT
jgi:hypothetical protein